MKGLPESIAARCAGIGTPDHDAIRAAEERAGRLTMPAGALDRVLSVAIRLAGITGRIDPPTARKRIAVLAADHGVTAEGVSAYPAEVTAQMVRNFAAGGAAINAIAGSVGASVHVYDLGVDADLSDLVDAGIPIDFKVRRGTKNLAREPAMTPEEAVRAVEGGFTILDCLAGEGTDLLAIGEMGIGNTTSAVALACALLGGDPESWTGPGTGLDPAGQARKAGVIRTALARHRPDPNDPLGALASVGGLEIAGMAGVLLAAAARRIPVVLDGAIAGVAALLASRIARRAIPFWIAGHRSAEPVHAVILERMELDPLLDLGFRLGEGSGAALAFPLVDAAVALLNRTATFESAGVSDREIPSGRGRAGA